MGMHRGGKRYKWSAAQDALLRAAFAQGGAVDAHPSVAGIARGLGLRDALVRYRAKSLGLYVAKRRGPQRIVAGTEDAKVFARMWQDEAASATAIARRFGLRPMTVYKTASRLGLSGRSSRNNLHTPNNRVRPRTGINSRQARSRRRMILELIDAHQPLSAREMAGIWSAPGLGRALASIKLKGWVRVTSPPRRRPMTYALTQSGIDALKRYRSGGSVKLPFSTQRRTQRALYEETEGRLSRRNARSQDRTSHAHESGGRPPALQRSQEDGHAPAGEEKIALGG